MAKQKKGPSGWSRPLDPAALAEYGELKAVVPEEDIDVSGTWKQSWRIFLLARGDGRHELAPKGYIRIERKPAEGGLSLTAEYAVVQQIVSGN